MTHRKHKTLSPTQQFTPISRRLSASLMPPARARKASSLTVAASKYANDASESLSVTRVKAMLGSVHRTKPSRFATSAQLISHW
jgi:hypothetical protein